jgi:hypothetical protein
MIAKDLVPISGIRSFAIMKTFVVALIFAIFERARNRSQFIENRLRISFTVSTAPKATVIVVASS